MSFITENEVPETLHFEIVLPLSHDGWIDTGIDVPGWGAITVDASGSGTWNGVDMAYPSGSPGHPTFPIGGTPLGAAKVPFSLLMYSTDGAAPVAGQAGTIQGVDGSQTVATVGRLYVGFNDIQGAYADNTGAFVLSIDVPAFYYPSVWTPIPRDVFGDLNGPWSRVLDRRWGMRYYGADSNAIEASALKLYCSRIWLPMPIRLFGGWLETGDTAISGTDPRILCALYQVDTRTGLPSKLIRSDAQGKLKLPLEKSTQVAFVFSDPIDVPAGELLFCMMPSPAIGAIAGSLSGADIGGPLPDGWLPLTGDLEFDVPSYASSWADFVFPADFAELGATSPVERFSGHFANSNLTLVTNR